MAIGNSREHLGRRGPPVPIPQHEFREVRAQEPLGELDHSPAVGPIGDEIRALLHDRQRVLDGDGAFAEVEEGMVVLGVPHPDHVAGR